MKSLLRNIYILILEILYFLRLIRTALIYFSTLAVLFVVVALSSGVELTFENLVLFLSLNYEPHTIGECVCLLIIFLIEMSPIMAFVEIRTLHYDEKARIRAQHMRDHIVVIGCGHLGRRVVSALLELGIPFVLIVLPRDREHNEFVSNLISKGVPVIFGDASLTSVLREANVEHARAVIISINDDYVNPVIAERIRKLNPNAKIIVRIYNDDIAEILKKGGFADEILSTSKIAVIEYILGCFTDIISEFPKPFVIKIHRHAKINGLKIADIENQTGVKVLSVRRGSEWLWDRNICVKEGDVLFIYGDISALRNFLKLLI
ncbi:MAG: potassium channel family protein [Candidatus Baldrarchaeia archaeon]